MTAEEVSTRYKIPKKILDEYQSWGLCDAVRMTMADWQYDDRDLERLGMIMALHDMGFTKQEVESYDFSGKTIVPFATSGGLGKTAGFPSKN